VGVSDKEIDAAVDAYIAAMEAGDPSWHELEEKATRLIERKHLEDE